MVLAYGCCCGNNQNKIFFQNTYFKESNSFVVRENLRVTINLCKQCHSMISWRKKAFAAAFFEGLWVRHFLSESKKTLSMHWST